jgi:hypothetical protein
MARLSRLRIEDLRCLQVLAQHGRPLDRAGLIELVRRRPQLCYALVELHIEDIRARAAERAQAELAYLSELARFA